MDAPSPLKRLARTLSAGNLWLYILSLSAKKQVYAYSLNEEIGSKFGFSPSRLMCYIVLYRLEAEGLISSRFVQRRKYYIAGRKGREALRKGKKLLEEISGRL